MVPCAVDCPCGCGQAERLPVVITEVYRGDRRQCIEYHNYRHSGCHIGGTIVTLEGAEYRRLGPLFDPDRYRVGLTPSEMAQQPLLADGGFVLDGGER